MQSSFLFVLRTPGSSKNRQRSFALLTRTQEERERLITEKVAIILMGEEDSDANTSSNPAVTRIWQNSGDVVSDLLRKWRDLGKHPRCKTPENTSKSLDRGCLSSELDLSPSNDRKDSKTSKKLKMTPQIISHNISNTPENSKTLACLQRSSIKPQRNSRTSNLQETPKCSNSRSLRFKEKLPYINQTSSHFSEIFTRDWRCILNKQPMSDVMIYVENKQEIPAHKLVFYVRCPAILYDLVKEGTDKGEVENLLWLEVPYNAAITFLEYLYCGTMDRILRLGEEVVALRHLAEKYQVDEVVEYIQVVIKVRSKVSISATENPPSTKESVEMIKSPLRYRNVTHRKKRVKDEVTSDSSCSLAGSASSAERNIYKLGGKCEDKFSGVTPDKSSCDRNVDEINLWRKSGWMSPDLFGDEVMTVKDLDVNCDVADTASQESRNSIDYLLSMMDKPTPRDPQRIPGEYMKQSECTISPAGSVEQADQTVKTQQHISGDKQNSLPKPDKKHENNFPELSQSRIAETKQDSFGENLNSSDLWKAERGTLSLDGSPRKVRDGITSPLDGAGSKCVTPEELIRRVTDKVTPLADYSAMKTPLLKKELFRYGLKPLKRKQAKQILRHIYNELHPWVPASGGKNATSPFKAPGPDTKVPRSPSKNHSKGGGPRRNTAPRSEFVSEGDSGEHSLSDSEALPSSQNSSSSCASSDGCVVEEMISEELDPVDEFAPGTSQKDFRSSVRRYITTNTELYERILRYEPVWLEELTKELKSQGLKFNSNQLMDYLDEQCITFRTAQGQRNRARKKAARQKPRESKPSSRGRRKVKPS
uniref:Structure-specific endonuclease subunit SLX4 n=1 Tax=Timema monikensis TaxID=170555 RepID=A0A7R9HPH5_9NEOP|nr:unnamed protein product [Timema monikensis]